MTCSPLVIKEANTRKRHTDEQRRQVGEIERHDRDTEAIVLISSTSVDCEGTFTVKVDNVAMPGPSSYDIPSTPRKRARKNVLNPDLAAALYLQK